jgi:hypothetical protein
MRLPMAPPSAASAALCLLGALLFCSAARAQVTPQWVVLEKGGYGGAHYDAVQDLAALTTLAVQAVHFHEFTSTGAEAGQRTLPVPAAPLESRVGGVAPLGEDYLMWWGGGVLTRVRSDGAERWRRTFNWSRVNTILGAYLDAAGDIIVWGKASCPRNPGSGCLGYYPGRLVKLTPDGVLRWEVNSSDYSDLSAVAEAPDGTYTAFGWAPTATPFNPGACAFALRVSSGGDILSHTCLLENEQHTRILGLTRLRGGTSSSS